MNAPSGGMKETEPGDFAQRDRRTHGWKEGIAIAPGGEMARVTSGVRDNRDVQSITPDNEVAISFPFLVVRTSRSRGYDDRMT